MSDPKTTADYIEPYNGRDMAGYMMEQGFKLSDPHAGTILSITNVGDSAIIVAECAIYRASPDGRVGFSVRRLVML